MVLKYHLQERTNKNAIFLVDEEALHTYVPYLLFPYGKSIQVVEPISLKQKIIDVLYELIHFMKMKTLLTENVSKVFYTKHSFNKRSVYYADKKSVSLCI